MVSTILSQTITRQDTVCGELVKILYIFLGKSCMRLQRNKLVHNMHGNLFLYITKQSTSCVDFKHNDTLWRTYVCASSRECTVCATLPCHEISVDCKMMVSIWSSMYGFKDTGWWIRLLTLNHSRRDISIRWQQILLLCLG